MTADIHPQMSAFLEGLGAGLTHFDPAAVDVSAFRENAALSRAALNVDMPPLAETRHIVFATHWGEVPASIFRPDDGAPLPVLIYLHGGGWTIGSVETHSRLMAEYAHRAGVAVIGLDYGLAPEQPFPAALYQVVSCLGQIRRRSDELAIVPSRIALGGDSAGATLAVGAALACEQMGVALPRAILASYGVYDTPLSHRSYRAHDRDDMLLSTDKMIWFWDQYAPHDAWRTHPLATPLKANLSALPPSYLTIAEIDILADENIAFAEKAERQGVSVQVDLCPGTVHGFAEGVALFDISRAAVARQCEWLRRALGC